jgi:Uncharacterized conserved protein (COG2071)
MSAVKRCFGARPDVRELHSRLGRVYHQPVSVRSFTNKRFTVNWRVPLQQPRRIVPDAIALDEVPGTGQGMLSMCACDFWVHRLGWLPIPPVRNNDMLCRVSARIQRDASVHRAYYTLRTDSSSHLVGYLGKWFSHFRKQVSDFTRIDDGRACSLECQSSDPICAGRFIANLASIDKTTPATSVFGGIGAATDFLFELDGICGYSYEQRKLSFQRIEHSPWDMYFCHEYDFRFGLIEFICQTFGLDAEIDCVLFMENTAQIWRSSWLYS